MGIIDNICLLGMCCVGGHHVVALQLLRSCFYPSLVAVGALWVAAVSSGSGTAQSQGSLAKHQHQRPRALLGALSTPPVQRARLDSE